MWAAKFLIGSLMVAIVTPAALNERQIVFGTCVEACSSSLLARAVGFGTCPPGYACLSNGCGHTCQPIVKRSERQIGICVELCPPGGCPAGQSCVSNGCGHYCA